jgi:predicted lipid-binding transport protein (Tim44 family)
MTQIPRTTRTPARILTAIAVALALALALGADGADARPGRGGSFGSRGSRTFQAPPPTNTAPSTVSPMDRSATPAPQRPGMAPPAAQPGGFFSRGGFLPGLMGGLIGAGIGGLLFGNGFVSGLGSLAGVLGLLLQIGLILFLVVLAIRFFRSRAAGQGGVRPSGPAYAGAGPLNRASMARDAGTGYGSGVGGGAARPRGRDEVGIGQADYEAFESILRTVQTAYGREDLEALRTVTTPEMFSYFAEELQENRARGVANRISDVRLLQGDLAEAWREGNTDYATVAMRYSLIDVTVDRATGRVVAGDPNRPVEAIEVWTFMRPRGGRWVLSAIQQAR